MPLDLKALSTQNISQLALDLDLEEIEASDAISPAEAQRRSDVSLQALRLRFKDDLEALEKFEKDQNLYKNLLTTNNTNDTKKGSQEQEKPVPPVKPNVFGWAEDFFLLMNQGWPWRVAVYIAWAGSPKVGRWPKNQEILATEVLGLNSDRQISDWRKNNPAIDEMIGIMQAMPLLSHRRDMFEALATSASDPSSKGAQDRKLGFAMLGDYVPRLKVEDERPATSAKEVDQATLDKARERVNKALKIEANDKANANE
jgi:hypothetical protein